MATKTAAASPSEGLDLSPQAQKLLGNLDKPSKKLKSDLWFKIIEVYPEGALCHCYIYRRWPQIDLKLLDSKAPIYIEKHEGPLTAEELLRTWGSGEYRLAWIDEGKPRGKSRICETVVDLHDPERPPVLDLHHLLLEAPANKSYVRGLRQRGELDSEDKPASGHGDSRFEALAGKILEKSLESGKASAPDIQERMLDLYQTASEKAIDIAAGAKPGDPIDQATKLMNLVKPDSEMLKLLMKSQQDMFKLMQNPTAGGGGLVSDLDGLEKVLNIVDRLSSRAGGGGTSWLSGIPDILTGVAGVMTAFASIKAGFSAPGPAAAAKPAGTGAAGSAARPAALPSTAAETAAGQPGPLTEADLTEIGKRALAAFNEGYGGDDFAVSLCLWRDEGVYRQIIELGHETLDMILTPIVRPEEQAAVKQFVAEFFSYGQEAEDQPPAADKGAPAEASAPASEATA